MSLRFNRRGFTLFELLAAVSISMIIAIFVFGFSNSMIAIMRSADSKIGTEIDANVALDIIARDLECAVFRDGAKVKFAVDAQSEGQKDASGNWVTATAAERPTDTEFDLDPPTHRYGWAGTYLRFFTAYPAFNAVSYQIIRRESLSGSEDYRYILHRAVVRKDHTEDSGTDITAGSYLSGSAAQGNPGEIRSPQLSSFLIENVVDFGVRLYIFDPSQTSSADSPPGLRLIYPADASGSLDASDRSHAAKFDSGTSYGERYPGIVEVYLRVLDNAGAERLLVAQNGGSDDTYAEIVAEHGRLYSRTVKIYSRSD